MSKAHDHQHDHGGDGTNARRLTLTLVLVLLYMGVEVVGGLLADSLALIADAGHMFSDAGALGLTLFAMRFARRPATAQRTYGSYRAEILAALVNGATLVAVAMYIFIEAFERLRTPPEVRGGLMLAVASGGLLVNAAGLWILHIGHDANLNMRGAWLHVLTDALGSLQAIIAGALIWAYGWYWVDPACLGADRLARHLLVVVADPAIRRGPDGRRSGPYQRRRCALGPPRTSARVERSRSSCVDDHERLCGVVRARDLSGRLQPRFAC